MCERWGYPPVCFPLLFLPHLPWGGKSQRKVSLKVSKNQQEGLMDVFEMSAKWISTFIWWWLFVEWDRWEVGVWRPGDANSMVSCNWRKCRPCVNLLCHAPQDLNYSKLLVCRFRFFPNTGLTRLAVLWLENTSVSAFCWMLQLFLSFFFFPTGVLAEGKSLQALVLEDYISGYNCGKKSFLFGNFLAKMNLPFKK